MQMIWTLHCLSPFRTTWITWTNTKTTFGAKRSHRIATRQSRSGRNSQKWTRHQRQPSFGLQPHRMGSSIHRRIITMAMTFGRCQAAIFSSQRPLQRLLPPRTSRESRMKSSIARRFRETRPRQHQCWFRQHPRLKWTMTSTTWRNGCLCHRWELRSVVRKLSKTWTTEMLPMHAAQVHSIMMTTFLRLFIYNFFVIILYTETTICT